MTKPANAGRIRAFLIGLTIGILLTCYVSKWSGVWCNHEKAPADVSDYYAPGP